ncbi:MAG: hypothetical protein IAA31_06245 [Candidatus Anaerobiospirillum merdipullorum]|uniref:Uncharacterized protein n=1 Tax=Candidatus Anaerobiospirillum merdipullorum TaxID=2838450 RepID=A0A9E2NSD3_9GAMM|nr:hypothetical protein [Candidatus Anaerobiospirillum merdipullorum]
MHHTAQMSRRDACYQQCSYEQAFSKLAKLRADMDIFLDAFKVNAEDAALNQNTFLILQ